MSHEYSIIIGIKELVDEFCMNLKKIVLKSNMYGTKDALISSKGLGYITTQNIILPSYKNTKKLSRRKL